MGEAVVQILENQTLKNTLLSSKYHLQLMKQCLESLTLFIQISDCKSPNESLPARLDGSALPPSLYSSLNDEVKLNKSFMHFVENYRRAYFGMTKKESVRENLVPCDPSFKELLYCFHHEGATKERVNKLKPLLNFLRGLYYRLQQPLRYQQRSDLDSIVFTILQLLSAITPSPRSDITQSHYEEVVKPLQEALVDIKPRGAHECVIIHLNHSENQVAVQAMAFLAALVYRGNEKTQQKIGEYLKHRDTELFMRMNAILQLAFVKIKASPLKSDGCSDVEIESEPDDTFQPLGGHRSDVSIEMTTYQPIDDDDYDPTTDDQKQERARLIQPDQTAYFTKARKKRKRKQPYAVEETDMNEPDVAYDHQEAIVEEATQQVIVVLDLVAWMCHGQRTENQDLFREQENQFNSVNIVSQVAIFLQALVEPLRDDSIHISVKAIQALTELCTGNFANQEAVYKAEIVDTINSVLAKRSVDLQEKGEEKLLRLKSHTLELLNILLQEISSQSCELTHKISRNISIDTILEVVLTLRNHQKKIDQMENNTWKPMFDALHALKRIGDNLNRPGKIYFDIEERVQMLNKDSEMEKKDKADKLEDVNKWSHSIEVIQRSKEQEPVLTRVYFPFNPKEQLSGEKRRDIGDKIDRTSQENRYRDLIGWMEEIYEIYMYKKNLKSSSNWLRWWSQFQSRPRHYALILLTLLMNLLTLIFFKAPYNQESGSGKNLNSSVFVVTASLLVVPSGYYLALYSLGSLHLILSLWMLIEYFTTMWRYLCLPIPIKEIKPLIKQLLQYGMGITDDYELKTVTLKYFDTYLLGFEPIYRTLFVCFSILSLAFSGYWYCGCLLYIFLKIKLMGQVLEALRVSALPLLIVFLLGLCIIFIYAVLSFALFHGYFNIEDGLFCETLAQCFATVTREGLLDTLGKAIPLKAAGEDTPSFDVYEWRTFFDLSFFVIITTIGLNIVIAIMVDSFSELRTQRNLRESVKNDKQSQCFICGIKSDEFDTKLQGFQDHVRNDHNMWNYIYFYIYLCEKESSDHNAVEKYVYNQVKHGRIEFLPCLKAKVLEKHDEKQTKSGTLERELNEELEKTVKLVLKKSSSD